MPREGAESLIGGVKASLKWMTEDEPTRLIKQLAAACELSIESNQLQKNDESLIHKEEEKRSNAESNEK